ncbi:MAG: OmpA family protein, partial [Gammaproteobacteria bacterium]|nr:OmpA family protein [Gammaproteobacteria bacterium]
MNQAFVVVSALLLFLTLTVFSLHHYGPAIERKIHQQASERLAAGGLQWATVETSGRHITLQGVAPSKDARDEAFDLIADTEGAVDIVNAIQLPDERFSPVERATSYETRMVVSPGFVRYTGSVPDQESSLVINQRTRELFPGRRLQNELLVRADAPDNWLDAIKTLQQRLATYAHADATISDSRLNVVGAVAADDASEAKLLAARLPSNFTTEISLGIAAVESAEDCQQQLDQLMQEKINFEVASDIIDRRSYDVLNKIATRIRQCGGLRIEIAGHTDSQGLAMKNLELSQRRAEAVVSYLVDTGIDADQL